MKKILFVLFFILFFILTTPVLAKTTPEPEAEVDTFDLFWPIVAGRVRGDFFYPLKSFKEKVREFLITNESKKAEYYSFLSTKRLVEYGELILVRKDVENAKETLINYEENVKKGDNLDVFGKQKIYINFLLKKVDESQKLILQKTLSTLDSRIKNLQ